MFQQNVSICPQRKHNLISSRMLFTFFSKNLLANCSFRECCIFSLTLWSGTRILLNPGCIFPIIQSVDIGQTKDLCCVEELLHLPSSPPPSCPILIHGQTVISYNLSFFVVQVNLYLGALMKPFDVLLRYRASFLAFCLLCLL